MTKATKIFLIIFFSLAAVGLFLQFKTNPLPIFLNIGMAVLILLAINRFAERSGQFNNDYLKTLQGQKKKEKAFSSDKSKRARRTKRSSSNVSLRVIQGGNTDNKRKLPKTKEERTNYQ